MDIYVKESLYVSRIGENNTHRRGKVQKWRQI